MTYPNCDECDCVATQLLFDVIMSIPIASCPIHKIHFFMVQDTAKLL